MRSSERRHRAALQSARPVAAIALAVGAPKYRDYEHLNVYRRLRFFASDSHSLDECSALDWARRSKDSHAGQNRSGVAPIG